VPCPQARPFLIGVAGGTCSGKTTVSERLAELAGDECLALIKLDSYYVSHDDKPFEEREKANYDHP
jgi:uridine kinase